MPSESAEEFQWIRSWRLPRFSLDLISGDQCSIPSTKSDFRVGRQVSFILAKSERAIILCDQLQRST